MATGKEIKARIKSVKNTGKITKAMELISTVKMKKAQESVLSSRPFALSSVKVFTRLGSALEEIFPTPETPVNRELIVVVSSNKGLCGGYNVNVFKQLAQYKKNNPNKELEYITIGKKVRDFVVRTGGKLVVDFSEIIKDAIEIRDAKRINRTILESFKAGQYDRVVIIYNHYVSAINQKPVTRDFLPISEGQLRSFLQEVTNEQFSETIDTPYTFEPDLSTIASEVIPMILDLMIFEMLLEGKASEHAARMVAMKNAKDSANKKVGSLTLTYNKARQAAITKEVSEIVSGVESMKD